MRKSVTAFVFGLIGGLFCIMWGFIFGLGSEVGMTACDSAGVDPTKDLIVYSILGWLAFIGGIVAIIGASQCFKTARRGGIILSCATVPCAALQIYIFSNAVGNAGSMIVSSIIFFLLPAIFLIVADVCAFLAKEEPELEYSPFGTSTPNTTHHAAPVQKTNSKTLEQELTELKAMYDKKLLTEDEYNQARQKAISQYTK